MIIRFFLILFITVSLYAQNKETCFTVQLLSVPISQKEKLFRNLHKYPKECQAMEISKIITLRCGCDEHITKTEKRLFIYKEKYKDAAVAVSYKYRFTQNKKREEKKQKKREEANPYSDTELRFILQAFLYSQDLEHAYDTIKIALKKDPDSLYWNQRMAEVLMWMDKRVEAFKYMKYIYNKTKNPKLLNKIIDYAFSNYQYEEVKSVITQTYLNNPTLLNKQRMLFIYNKVGEPQEGAKILELQYNKTKDPLLLEDILQVYIDTGDLKNAKNIIDIVEKRNFYSPKIIQLISYYYYIKGDINNSFEVIKKHDFSKAYNKTLNILYSDLGWYLQKYKPAAEASLRLIQHNEGRLVDYERAIYAKRSTESHVAMLLTRQAFQKYHLSYLFYAFADLALKEHKIDLLKQTLQEIDASDSALKKEANYYLVKARLYKQLHQRKKSIDALQSAMKIKPNNIMIIMQAIDIYMQFSMYDEVRILLNTITQNPQLPQNYLLPLAALYYTIHDVNQASFYLDKLKQLHSPLVNTREFQFLQDDLYKAAFNFEAHYQTLRKIRDLMEEEAQRDPNLLKEDRFLYDSLRISLVLDPIELFITNFQNAKKYLSKAHSDDIAYSYAVKIGATEQAHEVYLKSLHKPVWLQFANALVQQDHVRKEDLLLYHLSELPRDDASYGAHQEGDISLAQTLSFISLDENQKNQNAYISMLNYTKERSDLFSAKVSYHNRDPLLRKYTALENSTYISRGLYLNVNFNYYKNSILDDQLLVYVPAISTEFGVGAKQLFDKGEMSVSIGQLKSMCKYYTLSINGQYRINNSFTLKGELGKNEIAEESIQLLLGGKKDMLSVSLIYKMLQSTSFEVKVDQNRYSSQDNVSIGDGTYIQALLGHQIRNAYPDMRVVLFGNYGSYNENDINTDKGVIEDLRRDHLQILPNDFYNLGFVFDYGMKNSTIYTRVWRPFFEVSSFYNSDTGTMSYGLNLGYGGKVYLQDHLVFGANYTSYVNGIGGSMFELFLKYQFMYTH